MNSLTNAQGSIEYTQPK